jgi:electron transfer flavoprotein beta subunit
VKIVVCIKQVPDSEARVSAQNGQVSWGESPLVINPFDEYAVEAGLQQKELLNGELTALCIGPETARDALKHALAMGADNAVLVSDPALEQIDSQAAARVLAAAIQIIGAVDMVIFGRQTIDTSTGLTTAQTARVLGVIEEGKQTVSANLPAILSVVQSIGEPRYPSFMGIRKASKATIPVWSLSDLGLTAPQVIVSRTELINPPSRNIACEIITGGSPEEIAEALAEKILAEKIL